LAKAFGMVRDDHDGWVASALVSVVPGECQCPLVVVDATDCNRTPPH
jgi:hypothetical protein